MNSFISCYDGTEEFPTFSVKITEIMYHSVGSVRLTTKEKKTRSTAVLLSGELATFSKIK